MRGYKTQREGMKLLRVDRKCLGVLPWQNVKVYICRKNQKIFHFSYFSVLLFDGPPSRMTVEANCTKES
jgi:hypothetical protein